MGDRSLGSVLVGDGLLADSDRIYVAGHRGLIGSAIWRRLRSRGFSHLVAATSAELDLRDARAVEAFFEVHQPEVVILAAARTAGTAGAARPAEFLADNLRIQVNVMDAAVRHGVDRLLFLGSSLVYPERAAQPIPESALLTGPPELTAQADAIAKIAGIAQVQAVRRQYGRSWISALPANVYGPGDSFEPQAARVLPALIRTLHEGVRTGAPAVTLPGTGAARREFLHADDLAEACQCLLEQYDQAEPINVGTGSDLAIAELAELVAGVVGYRGELRWDGTVVDGPPRRVLDVSRLTALGWQARIPLAEGVRDTYDGFRSRD